MSGPRPRVRIGTSGWSYAHWRGVLYERGLPPGRWLERYAERFDTVELNASFYRLPAAARFAEWGARTPARFAFALKGSRFVTHVKRLAGVEAEVALFFERAAALGRKAEVALWQLPPDLERDLGRLEAFLALLAGRPLRQAVEFRHPSWWRREVRAALERAGVALVVPDSAARPLARGARAAPTADFAYLRLHDGRGRGGAYTEAQLRAWARRIAAWAAERDVYAYFNNDRGGHAVRNALRLRELLGLG